MLDLIAVIQAGVAAGMPKDSTPAKWVEGILRGVTLTSEEAHRLHEIVRRCTSPLVAQDEHLPTLEGVAAYLEHQDRMSFLDLRRAKQANYHDLTLSLLEDRWIAYGEAWGIVQKLWLETPKFKHDCDECVFLGRYQVLASSCDLYFCQKAGFPTVIGRFSDEGSDYTSGLGLLCGELVEAKRRAIAAGLLPQPEPAGL